MPPAPTKPTAATRTPVSPAGTDAPAALPDEILLADLPRVLFPECFMALNVFEPRYSQLLKTCLQLEQGVGILYRSPDCPDDSLPGRIGTYGLISDWYAQPDHTLSLNIDGLQRFRVRRVEQAEDGLLRAQVDWLPDSPADTPLPESFRPLSQHLQQLSQHPLARDYQIRFDLDNAHSVSYALAHLLPVSDEEKQQLLACTTPARRLQRISQLLKTGG